MSLDRELQALASRRPTATDKVRRWAERMILKRRLHTAYAQVFLDERDELTTAAKIVLDDLASFAGLGMAGQKLSDSDLRAAEGRRAVVLRLIDHLHMDDARLARMARQFREMHDE